MSVYDKNKILTFYHEAKEALTTGLCTPRTTLIYPSRVCNQNCYYCADKETNKEVSVKFMDRDLFLNLPYQVSQLGCEAIEMCGGGEPFLHPDIQEFINISSNLGLKLGTLTNGTVLQGSLADLVLERFSFVRISMDSFHEDTYNNIRHPRNNNVSLEKVIDNIRYLVRRKKETNSNLIITIKAVFNSDTIREMESFIDYGILIGVDGINIRTTKNVDNSITEKQRKEYTEILDFVKNSNNSPTYIFGGLNDSVLETSNCFVNPFHVFIDTDGSVRLCCYYQNRQEEHTIGNINNDSLHDIWWSELHKEQIETIDTAKCNLYNCKYHSFNKVLYEGIVDDKCQWQFT